MIHAYMWIHMNSITSVVFSVVPVYTHYRKLFVTSTQLFLHVDSLLTFTCGGLSDALCDHWKVCKKKEKKMCFRMIRVFFLLQRNPMLVFITCLNRYP